MGVSEIKKTFKIINASFLILTVLFAFSLNVFAIGFKAEDTYNSVVVIYSGNAVGSGFAIGENCIITNAHVVENANNISVSNCNNDMFQAHIFVIDKALDIAVLSVEGAVFPPLVSSDYRELNIGEDVYTIGAPNSMSYTLTKGVLSAKDRKIGEYRYIQFDAAINSGNSGGPLLNDKGEVIGVNTLKISNTEGIGLAVPMVDVNELLKNNGIEINEQGVLEGKITKGDSEKDTDSKSNTVNENPSSEVDINLLLVISLSISGILNIVLIVLLVYKKQRTVKMITDSSDRTDFDIDIME